MGGSADPLGADNGPPCPAGSGVSGGVDPLGADNGPPCPAGSWVPGDVDPLGADNRPPCPAGSGVSGGVDPLGADNGPPCRAGSGVTSDVEGRVARRWELSARLAGSKAVRFSISQEVQPIRAILPFALLLLTACPPVEPKDDSGPAGDSTGEEVDADGDGYTAEEDCDDEDPAIHPDAEEVCDHVDNDCDTEVDEGLLETFYGDADGDGFGDPDTGEDACEPPSGTVADGSDCDDGDPSVNPDGEEICDGIDNDCDGLIDDEDEVSGTSLWYIDGDGDGYGDPDLPVEACEAPSGRVADNTDCNDGDASVNPGATELADDGVDNDCNGWTDIDADLPSADEEWTVEVYASGIDAPMALAFDSAGNLYVGQDEVNGQIHIVAPGGGTATLFGPVIEDPDAVAVGADDTVYIGSEEGLYRVRTDGTAGLFVSRHMGNNTFVAVDFDGVLADPGLIYVANARAAADIVQVTPDGDATAFASSGSLYVPFGITFDANLMYVAEAEPGIQGIYTIDGDGELSAFLTEGLTTPHGIVYDPANAWFFVGDPGVDTIYTMSPDAQLTVFAEGVSPHGFTMDDAGNLYVSDHTTDPERILRFEPAAP